MGLYSESLSTKDDHGWYWLILGKELKAERDDVFRWSSTWSPLLSQPVFHGMMADGNPCLFWVWVFFFFPTVPLLLPLLGTSNVSSCRWTWPVWRLSNSAVCLSDVRHAGPAVLDVGWSHVDAFRWQNWLLLPTHGWFTYYYECAFTWLMHFNFFRSICIEM